MAKPKPKTSAAEVAFALSFLKYAGVKNAQSNVYLVLAVIAWMRQESGGLSRVIGNNPFNIRSSPFAIGYRRSIRIRDGKKINNGKFAIFKNLDTGARAAVALLKSDGRDGYRGYGLILRAATRAVGASETDKQQQAKDFLNAIALSKWDSAHYGTKPGMTADQFTASNHLISVWAALTGSPVIFPAPKVAPVAPAPAKAAPKAKQLDDKQYLHPIPDYLKPYEAFTFYESRRWVPTGPPGEAGGTLD